MSSDSESVDGARLETLSPIDTPEQRLPAVVNHLGETTAFIVHEDTLRLVLTNYRDATRARSRIAAPAGVFLTSLAAFAGDFPDIGPLAGETFAALFILTAVGSLIWMVWLTVSVFREREERNIDEIVRKLRKKRA